MTDPSAAVCGACQERAVAIREVNWDGEGDDAERERIPRCSECGHQPSIVVYRENRLRDLLPEEAEWPDDSGVRWSENLPQKGEQEDGAVLLVLGAREWDSLASRASLTFREEGVEVEVVKGRGPGVGFTFDEPSDVGGVQVDLPGEALRELQGTGRWSASVGGSTDPIHLKVVVLGDV